MTDFTAPPGAPGIPPRWTSSAKSAVGTAARAESRVWFTISHGILNEIYAPRLDTACIRDFGFIVTAQGLFFGREARHAINTVEMVEDGVPAFRLVNTALDGRYRISKTVFSDPRARSRPAADPLRSAGRGGIRLSGSRHRRAASGQRRRRQHRLVRRLQGAPDAVRGGQGHVARGGLLGAMARPLGRLCRRVRWLADAVARRRVATGVRAGRKWQCRDRRHARYRRAWRAGRSRDRLRRAAGGSGPARAAQSAAAAARRRWSTTAPAGARSRPSCCRSIEPRDAGGLNRYRVSTAVLATHRDEASGAIIASLSIPWGFAKGDDDLGGYHLVWPRDLVETAGGLLAAGAARSAQSACCDYLAAIQEADGHWSQNSWLDGRPYWSGIQIDETGISDPALRHAAARGRDRAPDRARYAGHDRRLRPAIIVRNGPATQQDRWEEDGGYSPFTLAVEIAALLAAADAMRAAGDGMRSPAISRKPPMAGTSRSKTGPMRRIPRFRASSDRWILHADRLFLGRRQCAGRTGSYRSRTDPMATRALRGWAADQSRCARAGALRPARRRRSAHSQYREGDRRAARRELPSGPDWYRYNDDGYGEHADGAPFDGAGIGRLWPLLTGERAHYELAAGRPQEARRLLAALEAAASTGGLLPEQIWDSEDIAATGVVSRPALGQRHAVGLGACRTYQAAAVAP